MWCRQAAAADDQMRVIEMGRAGPRPRRRLGLGYRLSYRLRWFLFHIFGPPQTSPESDPIVRLRRERAARVAKLAGAQPRHRRAPAPETQVERRDESGWDPKI